MEKNTEQKKESSQPDSETPQHVTSDITHSSDSAERGEVASSTLPDVTSTDVEKAQLPKPNQPVQPGAVAVAGSTAQAQYPIKEQNEAQVIEVVQEEVTSTSAKGNLEIDHDDNKESRNRSKLADVENPSSSSLTEDTSDDTKPEQEEKKDTKQGTMAKMPGEDPMVTADVEENSGLVHAELVQPPVQAYSVMIDEDPAQAFHADHTRSLGTMEMEQSPSHRRTKEEPRRHCWVAVAIVVVVAVVLAITLPLVLIDKSDDDSEFPPASPPTPDYPCYTNTTVLFEDQLNLEVLPDAFIICPNTRITIGTFRNPSADDFRFMNGDYPIMPIRENFVVQCGLDGRVENNCTLADGFIQVLAGQRVPNNEHEMIEIEDPIHNFKMIGITFTGTFNNPGPFNGNSVTISHPGNNIRFENCRWVNITAPSSVFTVTRNSFQEILDLPLEDRSVEITIVNSTFENILLDGPMMLVIDQILTVEQSRFENIQVTLLPRTCEWNGVPFDQPCVGLLYCLLDSTCTMSNVCVADVETSGYAVIQATTDSEFVHDNLYWIDSNEDDDCELGIWNLTHPDTLFTCSGNVFDEQQCPL